jgi:hypothetical protein
MSIVIEIFNGYTNDENILYRAEEELHQAEQALPGLRWAALSTHRSLSRQGRLDRIPTAKLEERWRRRE